MSSDKSLPWIPFAASSITGFTFAPLELGSTRSKSSITNLKGFKLISNTIRTEGLLSLWKGSAWFVVGNALARSTWIMSYDFIRNNNNSNSRILTAGFLSGLITAIVTNPVWTLKSYAQLPHYPGILYHPDTKLTTLLTSPITSYNNPLTIQNRLRTLNYKVLTSGTIPAMCYVSIESMCQLFTFEKIKFILNNYNEQSSYLIKGLSGALAGGLSRSIILPVTYPLHVITLRVREQKRITGYINIKFIMRSIHNDKAWYAGIGPYSTRVIFQSSILFFLLEGIRSLSTPTQN